MTIELLRSRHPRCAAASPDDTLTVTVTEKEYLQRLRGLGAWWRLGSSALEPLFLVHYAPVRRKMNPCTDS
ncbi:MAG TPA: hypothetical protein VIV88_12015 [Gemmatimonadales bacterium]|jgi:hypothetical protein